MDSWKGKSYDSGRARQEAGSDPESVQHVDQGVYGGVIYPDARFFVQFGTRFYNRTAPYSVAHYHGLPLIVPGGGGGISGYAWQPSSYQTMYYPGTTVHSHGLVGPQQLYYSGH